MAMAAALTGLAALTTLAAGATTTATTTAIAATVSVGGVTLAMALDVGSAGSLRTAGRTALGRATAGAVAAATTTTTTLAAVGRAFATLSGRDAGERRGGRTGGTGFRRGAEETFDPAEQTGGFFGVGMTGGSGGLAGGSRGPGLRLRTALLARLAGTAVALLRTVATTTITIAAAARLAIATATGIGTRGVAAGIGSAVQHGDLAATLGAEHGTLGPEGRLGAGSRRSRSRRSGGRLALVGEGRRFPALGGTLGFFGRQDVELGLRGGSDGFDDRRDGRDGSGGRSLHGFAGNNRSDRGRSRGHGGRSGGSNVRRSERVLVFRLRGHDLNRGGDVVA